MESGAALPFIYIADSRIAGYYTLSSYGIRSDDFPTGATKEASFARYDVIGATLLGRLAIDLTFQGKGSGEMFLLDAMKKALDSSRTFAASTGLAVEAKTTTQSGSMANAIPRYSQTAWLPSAESANLSIAGLQTPAHAFNSDLIQCDSQGWSLLIQPPKPPLPKNPT